MTTTDPIEKQSTADDPVHGMRRDARREILGDIALRCEAPAVTLTGTRR